MHLSGPECLTPDYTKDDFDGVVAVMSSTVLTAPANVLRWEKVKPGEVEKWFQKVEAKTWQREFAEKRITTMTSEESLTARHAEHLILRDLDVTGTEAQPENPTAGLVVAHARYSYYPAFPTLKEITGPEIESHAPKSASDYPEGFGTELHQAMNDSIIASLCSHFQGLPCFNLEGISTLTPIYLGKGVGKSLTSWVFPYADRFGMPVTLAASPLGLHLYRKCGFEEYRQHDIEVELTKYGGEGVHKHVIMVRWPTSLDKLPPVWQAWKGKNPPTARS